MSGKPIFLLFLFILANLGFSEIFKTSLFDKISSTLTFKRDIFSTGVKGRKTLDDFTRSQESYSEKIKKEKAEIGNNKEKKDTVTRNISYEGYTLKDNVYFLLINVDGEFFIGKTGEIIAEDIKILRGDKEILVIEIDNKEIEINIREFEE